MTIKHVTMLMTSDFISGASYERMFNVLSSYGKLYLEIKDGEFQIRIRTNNRQPEIVSSNILSDSTELAMYLLYHKVRFLMEDEVSNI